MMANLKHRMSPALAGTAAVCIECGQSWPCEAGKRRLQRQEEAAAGIAPPPRRRKRYGDEQPAVLAIADMTRSEYLAWCARHLATRRQRDHPPAPRIAPTAEGPRFAGVDTVAEQIEAHRQIIADREETIVDRDEIIADRDETIAELRAEVHELKDRLAVLEEIARPREYSG